MVGSLTCYKEANTMDMILDMSNNKIVFLTLFNYICLSAYCNYLIRQF